MGVAIQALGTQETFESALRSVRPGGKLSSLGVYESNLPSRWRPSGPGSGISTSSPRCAPAVRPA